LRKRRYCEFIDSFKIMVRFWHCSRTGRLRLIGGKVSEITAIQSSGERREVVITNIDIPFLTLVRIMVKWIIAAIPASDNLPAELDQ
jgi:hypothetical protein